MDNSVKLIDWYLSLKVFIANGILENPHLDLPNWYVQLVWRQLLGVEFHTMGDLEGELPRLFDANGPEDVSTGNGDSNYRTKCRQCACHAHVDTIVTILAPDFTNTTCCVCAALRHKPSSRSRPLGPPLDAATQSLVNLRRLRLGVTTIPD